MEPKLFFAHAFVRTCIVWGLTMAIFTTVVAGCACTGACASLCAWIGIAPQILNWWFSSKIKIVIIQ